jgi:YVTN family beta-propeller protein
MIRRDILKKLAAAGIAFAVVISAGFLAGAKANAQPESTPKQSLLVLSKSGQTLAIVDPATLKVVAKIPVGNDPHEVIASADGKTAYVSNYGGGRYNTLAVVDLVGQSARPPIDLGPLRGPHGLAFAGGKVWFTAEAAKAIGRFDPATNKVDWILGTGQNRTHMIWVSADEKRIVTSNVSSATVTIIDKVERANSSIPGGDWNEAVVPVGRGSEGFDVSPDGREIWVANAGDGTISIVDAAEKKVIATLDANVRGANRLKFTPDGKRVFVACLSRAGIVVFDAATRKQVKRFEVGGGAAGTVMDPDGKRAFVACSPENFVAVIDLATLEITGKIDVGNDPDGEAWAVSQ